ncbi:unnamed protein product [Protopolystoma xenopodis]|uniref:Uncharacterized protein n=1 Tax=Protopolystoma xenopodis TaxID=117903 RepID=A0A448WSX7_9PLAT|nr:unnamed protein product [Protopolystoma xenopodis]
MLDNLLNSFAGTSLFHEDSNSSDYYSNRVSTAKSSHSSRSSSPHPSSRLPFDDQTKLCETEALLQASRQKIAQYPNSTILMKSRSGVHNWPSASTAVLDVQTEQAPFIPMINTPYGTENELRYVSKANSSFGPV